MNSRMEAAEWLVLLFLLLLGVCAIGFKLYHPTIPFLTNASCYK